MTQAPNRRRLLLGLASAPALAAVTDLLPVPAMAAPSPDAALLKLGERRKRAQAKAAACNEAASAAAARAEAEVPERPVQRTRDWHTSPLDTGKPYDREAIDRWRAGLARDDIGLSPALMAQYRARGREVLQAWDDRLAARDGARDRHNVPVLERASEAADRAYYRLEVRIFEIPARTAAGLRLKARIAAHIMGDTPDGTYEDHLARAIIADLLALDA